MTSFFAELVHTNNGFTCSDRGFGDLSTAQECSDAVGYAKSFNRYARYQGSASWTDRPKGCYIRGMGFMHFNTPSTGEESVIVYGARPSDSAVNSICRKGNT